MLRPVFLSFVLLITPVTDDALLHSLVGSRAFSNSQRVASNTRGFDSSYKLSLPHPVQDKNFYLLSLFQRDPDVRKVLMRNQVLSRISRDKSAALRRAATCNDAGCFDELLRFSERDIETAAATLKSLEYHPAFRRLARRHLRPSGVFIKYSEQSDAQMLVSAWKDAANGMNRLLRVYGLGKDPLYKDIDRVSFDVTSETYRNLLKAKVAEIPPGKDALFFEPTLSFSMKLLEVNRRDEAGRYEPLEEGENKAALQNFSKTKWGDYPYSFILVLGSGPPAGLALSKIGSARADQAAELYFEHKAPLIILSGGHVHPMQTPYCEAIEMKKYLMQKHKVPETSILIDPFARHTTTNFRNSARLVFRYRIPLERNGLVTSSEAHITVVTQNGFRIRCTTELGYFPMEFINRKSAVTAEFKPSVESLFFDANDPLDP